ncbi:CDP-diacylglycerol--glycerol-3-phosphate 3-phosphatidyltransferase, mitochondrial [Anoplophora glabripennis]|nr:CDP-diacylglycerol--glycerol-3-phosphate 3-phosphatidyltransferase, mitochondrial [Anoplophora glabripennis]
MLRRLLNTVIETTSQPTEAIFYPNPFTKKETLQFGWLTNVTPCFPINAKNITILTEPEQFYNTLLKFCRDATKRITLVSLYLGNGKLEEKIVETLKNNDHFKSNHLKINILLDYTRGSRFENNSRTMLQPLLLENDSNCKVSLYHTPALRGLLKKYTPNRWNELLGLQHMKLYIFDDTLIISGANLSNDYFTNRQDRYFVIKDKRLSDFYSGLVSRVQRFSLQMDRNNNVGMNEEWKHAPYEGNKTEFVEKAGDTIEQYLLEAKDEQNVHKQEGFDTWILPMVQMGQLGIEQDAQITDKLLSEAPNGSKLAIATGYFNLTTQYMNTLIKKSQARCDILMAHPKANGFLGAKGPAGGIPWAYSLIAQKFQKQVINNKQQFRINLLEYLRNGWTYHAKGLWYYSPDSQYPCMTLIGSPNFGERSVKKDLETQLCIITENEEFSKRLHNECSNLYKLGLPAETERPIPKWVPTFVYFFRSYF